MPLRSDVRTDRPLRVRYRIAAPAIMNGSTSVISPKLRLATEPSIQLIMSDSEKGFGARFMTRLIAAPAKLESPTPIRISVTIDCVRIAASVNKAVAASAPRMAAIGNTHELKETRP